MKNILNIDNGIPTLLSNVDDGTNTLYINDELVPSSEWTGTGYYTFTSGGLTFTIQKIRDTSGNIMLQLIEQSGGTSYRLIKAISIDEKYYSIDDPAETDLADGDYLPFYDTSAGRKKKSLWSNIVDKIKTAFDNVYTTDDSASTTINDTDYIPLSDTNGDRKKLLWSKIVDKLKSVFVPLITHEGLGETYGAGSYSWGKIAIITVTNPYIDGPIVFEVSQRHYALSIIQVSFKNQNTTDPGLDYFITNNDNHYYIKKTATSTWELYANYSESYGGVVLHRVTGYRTNNPVNVTVVMENIAAPTGATQVSYGGNVAYASSAWDATHAARLKSVYSSRPTTANVQFSDNMVRYFLATSSMSEGKPTIGDAHILHMAWDNNGGWDGEIALGTADGMQFRNQNGGTWRDWRTIIHSSNIGEQVVAGVKDYYATSVVTKFGYGSPGMAQSAVTWLGAWDATVSGEYRLRSVRQADLKVAHAANAIKYDEIFGGYCSAANSWQTKVLASNYKLSTYKFLIFETRQYGNATQVYVEAVDRFKQHTSTENRIIMSSVTGEQYQIYYVNDTHIALAQTQVNGTYLTLHIYGMISV